MSHLSFQVELDYDEVSQKPGQAEFYFILFFLCDWLISIYRTSGQETALSGIDCYCFSFGCFYDLSFFFVFRLISFRVAGIMGVNDLFNVEHNFHYRTY